MAVFLVTGGAGYIGSHVCKALRRADHIPVTFDDLSSGDPRYVKWGPLVVGDLLDEAAIAAAMRHHRPDCVIHLAAVSEPGLADAAPARAHAVNVDGTRLLLAQMAKAGCARMIFGSTASVYGAKADPPFAESLDLSPSGVYAQTKLEAETVIERACAIWALKALIFRFFNVAGSDPVGDTGEYRPDDGHLIPRIVDCLRRDVPFAVFGKDHGTPDGTCIRDYVHVLDIARGFLRGLSRIDDLPPAMRINLGAGSGTSVLEVIGEAERVTGRRLGVIEHARRPFDPAVLVSDISRAARELDWRPERSELPCIIGDTWAFRAAMTGD